MAVADSTSYLVCQASPKLTTFTVNQLHLHPDPLPPGTFLDVVERLCIAFTRCALRRPNRADDFLFGQPYLRVSDAAATTKGPKTPRDGQRGTRLNKFGLVVGHCCRSGHSQSAICTEPLILLVVCEVERVMGIEPTCLFRSFPLRVS